MKLPNLAGIATKDLVQKKEGKKFQPSYINWARTMHLLHDNAPGWLPGLTVTGNDEHVHKAPNGSGYLLIHFKNDDCDGRTPSWPQAIMNNYNDAIPYDQITARDVTDAHRRGICAAAAGLFGLAYELWAKMELEDPYSEKAPSKESHDEKSTTKRLESSLGNLKEPVESVVESIKPDDKATDQQAPLTISDIPAEDLTAKNVVKILREQAVVKQGENLEYSQPTNDIIKDACQVFILKDFELPNTTFSGLSMSQKRLMVLAARTGKLFERVGYDVLPF